MLKRNYGSRNLGLKRANVQSLEVEPNYIESVISYNKTKPLHVNYGAVRNSPAPGIKRTAIRSKSPNVPLRRLTTGGRMKRKTRKNRK